MPKLISVYTRALQHLTRDGKLPFEKAAEELHKKMKYHANQVSVAKAAWNNGTKKLRILSYGTAKSDLENKIAEIDAKREKTVDDILLEGQLRQQLHDIERMHARDTSKK